MASQGTYSTISILYIIITCVCAVSSGNIYIILLFWYAANDR